MTGHVLRRGGVYHSKDTIFSGNDNVGIIGSFYASDSYYDYVHGWMECSGNSKVGGFIVASDSYVEKIRACGNCHIKEIVATEKSKVEQIGGYGNAEIILMFARKNAEVGEMGTHGNSKVNIIGALNDAKVGEIIVDGNSEVKLIYVTDTSVVDKIIISENATVGCLSINPNATVNGFEIYGKLKCFEAADPEGFNFKGNIDDLVLNEHLKPEKEIYNIAKKQIKL